MIYKLTEPSIFRYQLKMKKQEIRNRNENATIVWELSDFEIEVENTKVRGNYIRMEYDFFDGSSNLDIYI